MIFLKIFFSVFVSILVALLVSLLIILKKENYRKQKHLMDEYIERAFTRPFVVSEYLSRIEKEYIKIIEERKKNEPYKIVLWIGIDGLKLNEDGTSEWIKKGQKDNITYRKTSPGTYQYYNFYPSYTPFSSGLCNAFTSYTPYQQFYPMYSLQQCCFQRIGQSYSIQQQSQNIEQSICQQIQQANQNIINLERQISQSIQNQKIIESLQCNHIDKSYII